MLYLRVSAAMMALLWGALFCCVDCPAPIAGIPIADTVRYPLDCYDRDAYLAPIWGGDSNIVYHESVMPLMNPDGSMDDIPLLYAINEIISVRSSDLQTEYTEDQDYALIDGKLRILEGGSIQRVAHSTMYPTEEIEVPGGSLLFPGKGGVNWVWCEGGLRFHEMQLDVTYIRSDAFHGALPARQGKRLPKTMAKLQFGEPLRVLVYGDSISVGAQSSGWAGGAPHVPAYYDLFAEGLRSLESSGEVTIVNRSVGGAASYWGAENAREAATEKPDLAVIAFGMNDGSGNVKTCDYIRNTLKIMAEIRAQSPDCEFILVATMLPNPKSQFDTGMHEKYLCPLKALAQKGVAVADMTTMHRQLLERKRYEDFNGNNINHPNDFLARVYAQVLLETVCP